VDDGLDVFARHAFEMMSVKTWFMRKMPGEFSATIALTTHRVGILLVRVRHLLFTIGGSAKLLVANKSHGLPATID
jgi:hypothetical protein